MAQIGIAGGSGYGGVELVQILRRHPHVEIAWISSQQHAGKKVEEVYPHLRGLLDLRFSPIEELPTSGLDVLFLGLPHGEAMKIVPALDQDLLIIDLSGDFRIADSKTFEEFYHLPPPSPQEQKSFV